MKPVTMPELTGDRDWGSAGQAWTKPLGAINGTVACEQLQQCMNALHALKNWLHFLHTLTMGQLS